MHEFADLRVFTKVVAAGSFSAAARQLGLPPSTVSRRIAALEQRLGVPLFVRTTRHVTLTEAGRAYHGAVRRVLENLEEADHAVALFRDKPRGTLRVQSRVSLGARLIAPLLPKFMREQPGLKIDLRLTSQQIDTLADDIDIGIRFGLGPASSLITRRVVSAQQGLYASPAYIAEFGLPETPEALLSHNCLAFVVNDEPTIWRIGQPEEMREVRIEGLFQSNDVGALLSATLAGCGISIFHHYVVREEERRGRLVRVLPEHQITTMATFDTHVYVMYPPNMQNAPKIRAFTDFLVRYLPEAVRA
ncbi:LysR family transcriptional regulator [Bosea sp. BK604]|uniref:LysR family transcriptional regulator n=1 Tax=Bosea sp. BK604 TaxID=2512180 RepID=UPI00104B2A4A|nr:LysR family transcriptional regulator [Bosea sp. BK604]TCR66187.1 LysR family transcriptional regulator [Bosea sp. BK604]